MHLNQFFIIEKTQNKPYTSKQLSNTLISTIAFVLAFRVCTIVQCLFIYVFKKKGAVNYLLDFKEFTMLHMWHEVIKIVFLSTYHSIHHISPFQNCNNYCFRQLHLIWSFLTFLWIWFCNNDCMIENFSHAIRKC